MAYYLTAPKTPGARPTTIGMYRTLASARAEARRVSARRSDLRGQDVRIERADGALVEYAGPAN